MPRRRLEDLHENHDRWVISYADFITLLFAFFVVMYSISSVNDGKYRVLSDSLVSAFAASRLDTIPVDDPAGAGSAAPTMVELPVPGDFPADEEFRYNTDGLLETLQEQEKHPGASEAEKRWESTAQAMADAVADLVSDGDARVVDRGEWLEVNLRSGILFQSGSAALSPAAGPVLSRVAAVLRDRTHAVTVEGHTDAVPISTEAYPSNWELSAARAAAVVRAFATEGVSAPRLAATGYGAERPIADNGTEEGRASNRRIGILIARETAAEVPPTTAGTDRAGVESRSNMGADRPRQVDYKLRPDDARERIASKFVVRSVPVLKLTLEEARQRWQSQSPDSGERR